MKLLLSAFLVMTLQTAFADFSSPITSMTCKDLKRGHQTYPNIVTVTADKGNSAPQTLTVDNLPEGSGLKMSYQDIFGHNPQPDGAVIYVPKGEGDGMVQDVCEGDEYNVLFLGTNVPPNMYCAKCDVVF